MTTAELIIKSMENEGVKYVFGVAGEENLDILEALRISTIQFIPTRSEAGAGFMAATVGRLTGRPGVCLSTVGPGATNFATAVAYANLGGMPAVFLTGQKPIKKSKQGEFQIVDTLSVLKSLTKFSTRIFAPNSAPSLIRELFRVASEERPGAVHLEIPEDVAAEIALGQPLKFLKIRRPVADEKAISQASELISKSLRPLVVIGAGANRKLTATMLREFIDKLGVPFVSTQMGKGVVDERHPLYLGTTALSSGDYIHCALDRADLIINVGHDVAEKPPFIMTTPGPTVIHINFYSAKVDEIYFPQLEVVGDVANTLWQLKERLRRQATWDFSYYVTLRQVLMKTGLDKSDANSFPLLPQRIVADVRLALSSEDILALDNGMYKLWFARNYPAHQSNTLLLDNALATMGAGLPSAIAAKLINPERRVVAVCGDGGFMMSSMELETAVRLGLDLTIIIINDNAYGMIAWKQRAAGLADFGLSFNNPDFVAYVKSFGAMGTKISSAAELVPAIQAAMNSKGVNLIEVPVDYSENQKVLVDELKAKVCAT